MAGIVFGREVSIACECHVKRPIAEEFENSHAVFLGQVIEISTNEQDDVIKFKVEKIWKGNSSKEIATTKKKYFITLSLSRTAEMARSTHSRTCLARS